MFILASLALSRVQIRVEFDSEKEKITGPWKSAVDYLTNTGK